MRTAIRVRASRSRSPVNRNPVNRNPANQDRRYRFPVGSNGLLLPQMTAKTGEKPQMRRDIFRFGKFLPSFELSRLP